jgi:hypothetical protein
VDNETGAVSLITRLMYGPDGEQLSSVFPLYVSGLTDQQVGSKLTYTKRYQLCAILGVHPVGDDDDGNLAATAQAQPEPEEPAWLQTSRLAMQAEIAQLNDADKELVKLEIRNLKIPSLKKPGVKIDKLAELREFLDGLRARAEPFDLDAPAVEHVEPETKPFTPTTFDEDLRNKPPSARQSIRNSMREDG